MKSHVALRRMYRDNTRTYWDKHKNAQGQILTLFMTLISFTQATKAKADK